MITLYPHQQKALDLTAAHNRCAYYQNEWDWEAVKPYVLDTINRYFKELAETWADQEEPLVVRISQLESRILSVSGILDISNTTINEEAANYPLPLDHIPVLGSVIARG